MMPVLTVYIKPYHSPLFSVVNDVPQDFTVLSHLQRSVYPAHLVETVQVTLPQNQHFGDILRYQTLDLSTSNNAQMTTVAPIKTSAVCMTTSITCPSVALETVLVFSAENVSPVLQKLCSLRDVEPTISARITGSGPLRYSTAWRLRSFFLGKIQL